MTGNDSASEADLEAASWFARLQSDDVADLDYDAFRNWLNLSANNQKAYHRIVSIWARAPSAEHLRPLVDTQKQRGWIALVRIPKFAPLAAVVAVLLASIVALAPRQPATQVYTTAVGQQSNVRLADGSLVELNTDTAIRVQQSARLRRLDLIKGEAFFTVAPDASRPFVVHAAAGMTARAVGTEFSVRQQDENVTLVVVEGRVAVYPGVEGSHDVTARRLVTAGQEIDYRNTDKALSIHTVKPEQVEAWRNGKLIFQDVPLQQAVDEINRYRAAKIVIEDPVIRQLRVGGVFAIDRGYELIRQLEKAGYVQITQTTDGSILLYGSDRPAP